MQFLKNLSVKSLLIGLALGLSIHAALRLRHRGVMIEMRKELMMTKMDLQLTKAELESSKQIQQETLKFYEGCLENRDVKGM